MKKITGVLFLVCICIVTETPSLASQAGTPSEWHTPDVSFRVLNITNNRQLLWICGTDESVALSLDNGAHWQVKHQVVGGGLLLNIAFVDTKFGYAAGTGGLILATIDGGETWAKLPGNRESILQVSFSDPQHALLRTSSSLLFTVDGGANWTAVSAAQNSEVMKKFPYTFSLVALDAQHMAVMLKLGAAQYETQTLLYTQDSGGSWKVLNIPNVTLYSFLRVESRYWAVGTEVIHKDQPGGGYAVPVALYSSDGENWNHSTGDLSACKRKMCTVCNAQGCLSSNGTVFRVFLEKTDYGAFAPNKELSAKWAATDSTICFVGSSLQCADLKYLPELADSGGPAVPTAVSPGPLGAPTSPGPRCVSCGLDQIFVDRKVQGAYKIKLALGISKNGTVTSVEVQDAPSPELKSRVAQQVQQWIFEPYLKDGVPVNTKLNTSINVNVIKPR